mmetsp:Transcript_12032/g.25963  ORF Transcript_12032/g.25963 Transcript_12032/m.25963 type:complete len:82 (+) Transcript_12032:1577-1822(+)
MAERGGGIDWCDIAALLVLMILYVCSFNENLRKGGSCPTGRGYDVCNLTEICRWLCLVYCDVVRALFLSSSLFSARSTFDL